jgi:hypothetical protein
MTDSIWHYQLMRHTDDNGEEYFAIHEYYPDKDGDGWTEAPVDVVSDTFDGAKEMLHMMLEDIEKYGVKDYE